MKLIVGLGNPGLEYENTRHNIGFKVIDAVAHQLNVKLNKKKFNGIFFKDKEFILAKPLTYMNNSGDFVKKIQKFFNVKIEDILIVYDDIDLNTAQLRVRSRGSSGGQRGIKDIIEKLNTNEIKRLKIGVGRPKNGAKNWVLGHFTPLQVDALNKVKPKIIEIILNFISE